MKNKENAVRDVMRMVISEYPRVSVPLVVESGKKITRPKQREEVSDKDILDIVEDS